MIWNWQQDAWPEFTCAAKYMKITAAPSATATRDLAALVAMGALTRTGSNKATRYHREATVEPAASLEIADML